MALTVAHTSQPAESPGALTRTQWIENHAVSGTYEAFPVGSIYLAVVSTNPGTLLGYGTWSSIGAGRVLIGLDSGDTDFDTVEETGGAKTKAISAHAGTAVADHAAHTHSVTSNVAVGNHSATQPTIAWPAGVPTNAAEATHTHTYNTVIAHTHTLATGTGATGNFSQVIGTVDTSSGGTGATPTQTALGTLSGSTGSATGTTSAGASHNHAITWPAGVPTASGGGVDAHSVTNNAVTSGNPNATLTHSVTQPSAHTDLNVVQPYFVCYMWKRTA